MFTELFLLMILFHIIDDFVLQPICLSKLKQKSYWDNACEKLDPDKVDVSQYKNDYIAALIMHSLSWSIMIMIPVMLLSINLSIFILYGLVIINTFIHAFVDNKKANEFKFNLIQDQAIHLIQITITYLIILLVA